MIVPYIPPSPHVYLVGQDPTPTVVFMPWWVVWSLVGVVVAVLFALTIAVGHGKETPKPDSAKCPDCGADFELSGFPVYTSGTDLAPGWYIACSDCYAVNRSSAWLKEKPRRD